VCATDNDGVSLQEFFSRPIKLLDLDWAAGGQLVAYVDPWTTFFENPRVANRLVNYHLLRARMHVRIMVNGNSFYYGRMLASYRPLPGFDQFSTSRVDVPNDMIQESQRPHVFINPTESQGGDLILPFIWQSNALQIPQREWSQMGTLVLRSFDVLKHANGSTDPLTISIFAWAEDVHLSIPTSNQFGALEPQAGPDEYSGIVSKPANVVAKLMH